jgi:predicted GTPase
VGSIRDTYQRYPHMTELLPAMGYSDTQRHELEETISRTPADLVLVATPIDLSRVIRLDKPSVRVSYEVEELTTPGLSDALRKFVQAHQGDLVGAGK